MFLRDACIQRPVLAIVINLFLLLAGLWALTALPVRYLPQFDVPMVTVTTLFPGGSADLVEQTVTVPVEQAVTQVNGLDYVSSVSTANLSTVQMVFRGDVDPAAAAAEVRAKVNEAQRTLPNGAEAPVVTQLSLDSQPTLYLSFTDPNRNALEITDIVERVVKPQLAVVPGVANLQVLGKRAYAVRVWIDRFKLASEGLTLDDVIAALQAQNVDLPGGEIIDDNRRVSVRARTTLSQPTQFDDLVLRSGGRYAVRLGDVAEVEVTAQSADTAVRIDGAPAVAVGIQRQSDANPVEISDAVEALVPAIQRSLPGGMKVEVAYDSAVYIDASVYEVFETIAITIALVVVVVMLFLASLRSSIIALVAIPLSLGGGLAFLLVMGYSLNIFTLLAFVLVIGLVVDDAIVEVENIQRHVDHGMDPINAGFKGSREIGFAVVAMTTTLAAVYAPIGLLPGTMGALLREFAFTLAATVIVSGFVAMTLSPMMCSRILRRHSGRGIPAVVDRLFAGLAGGYRRVLGASLRHRWLVVLVALAAVGGGFATMARLNGELAPVEDQGFLLVLFSGPQDASPDYMTARADAISAVIDTVPEKGVTMAITGMPSREQGMVFSLLKPWGERTRTAMEIEAELKERLADIPGARVAVLDPNPLGGGGQRPIQFVLKSTLDYPQLQEAAEPLLAALRDDPELRNVSTDLSLNTPVIGIDVDRAQAAEVGVEMRVVADAMGKLLGDQEVNRFQWQGNLYPVLLGLHTNDALDPRFLEQVFARGANGNMVPFGAFSTIRYDVGAAQLNHFDQLHAVTVSADLAPGASLAAVSQRMTEMAERLLPPTVQTDWNGMVRQLREANASMGLVFVLAFAVIYMVLAAQFESFRDPFIVLSVAPLSIAGAGFALALEGGSINLYSGIGFITLVGLIAKHGILITEFANQLRDEGMERMEALVEASATRLRPILMTTAAMVLGAVPLAIASGPGAESRRAIGWVIVGGMLFGTLLSLFVIPTAYSLLSRKVRRPMVAIPGEEALRDPGPPAPAAQP